MREEIGFVTRTKKLLYDVYQKQTVQNNLNMVKKMVENKDELDQIIEIEKVKGYMKKRVDKKG